MTQKITYEELEQRVLELEKTGAALNKSENRYRLLIEHQNDLVVHADAMQKIIYASPSYCNTFGKSQKEIIGYDFKSLIHPEDINVVKTSLVSLIKPSHTTYHEERAQTVHGWRWFAWSVRAHVDGSGDMPEIFAIGRDINQQKLAELALSKGEERFRSIYEHSSIGIARVSLEFQIENANEAYCNMLGYREEELVGKYLQDITHPETLKGNLQKQSLLTAGEIDYYQMDKQFIHKSGNIVYGILDANLIRDDVGKPIYCIGSVLEITKRKLAEEVLQKSEERYRLLFENAGDAIYIHDTQARILTANPKACSQVGYSFTELTSMTVAQIDAPEDACRFQDRSARLMGQGHITFETVHRCKDGSRLDIEVKSQLIDWEGQPGIMSICRNITKRKQDERALLHSASTLRQILVNTPQVGISLDAEAKITFVNDHFQKLTGWEKEKVVGHNWFDMFISEEDREKIRTDFKKFVRSEDTSVFSTYENDIVTRHGKVLRISWANVITRDIDEKFLNVTCFGVDLTERSRIEQELRQSESKFRSMMEAMKDPIYICSTDFRVIYMNPAMNRRVEHDAIGEYCFQCLHGFNEKCSWCQHEQVQLGKSSEFEIVSPKDNRSYLLSQAPVQSEDGSISKMTVYKDITELREIESQFQQAQKMESVGRLAGGVAHDYNNMLSVIIGYTELAMSQVDRAGELHNDLREILAAAKRSADITKQLLAFARKQIIEPQVLNLNEVVENMLKMLRRLIGEDIKMKWEPAPLLWSIQFDPTQVDQLLANLCVNARDAINGVGKISVETDKISLDEDYCSHHPGAIPGDYALLMVSDTGCGMSKEVLGQIFEPFYTTKELGQGTGLGLATVYGIVKQNNGFISVYSEPDHGTTFRIYLPRHVGKGTGLGDVPDTDAAPEGHGEIVLVVEDEVATLKLIKRILVKLGYVVLAAETPKIALEFARKHQGKIQVLITDVIMPEMNGKDMAELLKGLYPELRVLFMSGYTADIITRQGGLVEGMNFIQKPFTSQEIAIKVRKELDRIQIK